MEERCFGIHAEFVRSRKCLVPRCNRLGQAAHVDPRQMGGCGGDWRVLVPLCGPMGHHGEQEGKTVSFGARYGLNLHAAAALLVIVDLQTDAWERAGAVERLWGALQGGEMEARKVIAVVCGTAQEVAMAWEALAAGGIG
jgi:hypothetical protein